ncbi:MAG: CotH kinase family protein [Fibrobacterota bacterium]
MEKTKMLICATFVFLTVFPSDAAVVINEFVSSNGSTLSDEDGDFEDWIEIYNSSADPIQLEGLLLSDDLDKLDKWSFPPYTLQSGEHLIVFTSGKDRTGEQYFHTSFRISSEGEPLIISNPDGDTIDMVPAIAVPRDVSYGRVVDGGDTFSFFSQPTPGASNTTSTYGEVTSAPVFSHQGGFYSGTFDLTLSSPDSEALIYYTIDGSIPDPENISGSQYSYKQDYGLQNGEMLQRTYQTRQYTGPISIQNRTMQQSPQNEINTTFESSPYIPVSPVYRGVCIRAIAVKEGSLPSPIKTHTYFVDSEQSNRYPVQVASISLPESSLFSYESGIYVAGKVFDDSTNQTPGFGFQQNPPANYTQRGDMWERTANFELFSQQGDQLLNQAVGLRIHGGWTRTAPNKSLRLYARKRYEEEEFSHQFFETKDINTFKTILLRQSGNDHNISLFRDALIQSLVSSLNIDQQASRPVVLFINGEYWGVKNIRDRLDKHYLRYHHGVDPENLDILSPNNDNKVFDISEGDDSHYSAMLDYISENDISDPSVYDNLNTMMDIENYITYQAIQIYSHNTDWPHNNNKWWRLRTDSYQPDSPYGHDGRWRWMLYDLDFGFGIWRNTPDQNTLQYAACPNDTDCKWATTLFRTLLQNDNFRVSMINRFADLMNTVFHVDTVVEEIREIKEVYSPLIEEHINRWGQPEEYSDWEGYVDSMVNFATVRKMYMVNHILDFFDIEDTVSIMVNNDENQKGIVRINTAKVTDRSWTGTYFSGIPIQIQAVPSQGYRFSHWSGSSEDTSATLNIVAEQPLSFTPNFVEDEMSTTTSAVKFSLPAIQKVDVFNARGQKVAVFSGNELNRKSILRQIRQEIPAGIYYLKMSMGKRVTTEKITFID